MTRIQCDMVSEYLTLFCLKTILQNHQEFRQKFYFVLFKHSGICIPYDFRIWSQGKIVLKLAFLEDQKFVDLNKTNVYNLHFECSLRRCFLWSNSDNLRFLK